MKHLSVPLYQEQKLKLFNKETPLELHEEILEVQIMQGANLYN
jgi:hypothetical protein